MKRWFNKRDDNEPALIAAAGRMGISWYEGGPLDGWIPWLRGTFVPVEIKNPDGRDRPQPSQIKFMRECDLNGWRYEIWRTVDDIILTVARRNALTTTSAPKGPSVVPFRPKSAHTEP